MGRRVVEDQVPDLAGRGLQRLRYSPLGAVVVVWALLSWGLAAGSGSAQVLPNHIYGGTLDNDADLSKSKLQAQVDALSHLPARPMVRIVLDRGTNISDYALSYPAIRQVSSTMAELGDSSEVKGWSDSSYGSWVQSMVTAYAKSTDVWEVGNEVNGEWVGPPAAEMARVTTAYDIVKRAQEATALTLYYNPNCYEKKANELWTWLANGNVPPALASGLDYVFISYYPSDCNGYWPSAAQWQSVFDRLHAQFPQARLGFGESGDSSDKLTPSADAALWSKYVDVKVQGDNYIGFYGWWYWAEDAVPYTGNAFWHAFANAESAGAH